MVISCIGGENRSKPPTCRKSLTKFITKCCIEYTSPWSGFELITSVVIGINCTDSWTSQLLPYDHSHDGSTEKSVLSCIKLFWWRLVIPVSFCVHLSKLKPFIAWIFSDSAINKTIADFEERLKRLEHSLIITSKHLEENTAKGKGHRLIWEYLKSRLEKYITGNPIFDSRVKPAWLVGLWFLMSLSTIFQLLVYIVAVSFIGWKP